MLIPGTNNIITAGKEGPLYVYDKNNLGKYGRTTRTSFQKFRARDQT